MKIPHSLSGRKRIHKTSIDRDHYHVYKLGKARTQNAIFYDDLAQLDIGLHHHPIRYDAVGNPTIGRVDGHDHQS